ncbi:MAG: response regulator [Spirulina sp.]
MEKVFEAFGQTTSGVRTAQGTGLGLPISQQFVCLMGGDLHLESEVGRGSKFFFEIPIVISEENMTESEIANRKPIRAIPPPDFPEDTYRILVVEDREYNGLLLFNLLTFLGFEVEIAENGVEAIALWQSWHPHLIWMDIQMPVMDGYEATRQIREQEEEREKSRESDSPPITHYPLPITEHRVPIIALTASAFVEDRQKALAAGCDDFLSKPFQEVELLAKMEEHLGLKYFYEEKNSSQNDSDPFDSASLLGDSRELGDDRPLKPSALQVMPEHWRQQLYEASLQCSDRLIQEAIAEIPEEYSNLEIALSHLIEDFRFDVVMELAKQSIE